MSLLNTILTIFFLALFSFPSLGVCAKSVTSSGGSSTSSSSSGSGNYSRNSNSPRTSYGTRSGADNDLCASLVRNARKAREKGDAFIFQDNIHPAYAQYREADRILKTISHELIKEGKCLDRVKAEKRNLDRAIDKLPKNVEIEDIPAARDGIEIEKKDGGLILKQTKKN
jgi:hypothetical protein